MTSRTALPAAVLALGLAAGCAAESPEIHLLLVSDLLVPDEVDLLEVTVTASQTAAPRTCSPATFALELPEPDDGEEAVEGLEALGELALSMLLVCLGGELSPLCRQRLLPGGVGPGVVLGEHGVCEEGRRGDP